MLFNQALPDELPRTSTTAVDKKVMGADRRRAGPRPSRRPTSQQALDDIKNLCFRFASQSGLTISIDDVKTPVEKKEILDRHEKEADKVEQQFRRGIITDGERRQKEVEIWTDATDEVQGRHGAQLKAEQFNPIEMMVGSGARGNMMQVRQIAGMRGLVANPRGDMIPRPIKSNFREGLTMLEYFIATPGARKGLVDTALRTADSGYLTRRLVDVAQELIINDERPVRRAARRRSRRHLDSRTIEPDTPGQARPTSRPGSSAGPWPTTSPSPTARCCAKGIDGRRRRDGRHARRSDDHPGAGALAAHRRLGDSASRGAAYGLSLATGIDIEVGEAVGVIAAQSIGEPGTQLTMRTFHTGGIAGGGDIAGGLPRVVELFEARTPKGKATLARTSGVVRIGEDEGKGRAITIVGRRRHRGRLHRPRHRPARGRRRRGDHAPATPSSTGPAIPRSSSRSRASARPSSTSSTRSRRCTATRACRSTTSTSS